MCIENRQVYELPNGNKLLAVVTEDGTVWLLPSVAGGDLYAVGKECELERFCGFGLAPFRLSQIVGTNWERTHYTVDDLRVVGVTNMSLDDVTADELNDLPYIRQGGEAELNDPVTRFLL